MKNNKKKIIAIIAIVLVVASAIALYATRYKFGLRQQECQARHFATILTEYGDALRDKFAEKDKPAEKEMDNDKILDELNLIIMELYAREVSNNCVVRELQSESWIALCNKGIELFKQLKV